jgi:hypothetical protein
VFSFISAAVSFPKDIRVSHTSRATSPPCNLDTGYSHRTLYRTSVCGSLLQLRFQIMAFRISDRDVSDMSLLSCWA